MDAQQRGFVGPLGRLAAAANNVRKNAARLAAAAVKPTTRGKCWGMGCSVMGGKRRRTKRRRTRRQRN